MFRPSGFTRAVAFLLLVVPGLATASATRLDALGGDGSYLEDARNARRWYGCLVDYPRLATVESGRFDQYRGFARQGSDRLDGPGFGVHWDLQELGGPGTLAAFADTRAPGAELDPILGGLPTPSWQLVYALPVRSVAMAISWRHAAPADLRCDTGGGTSYLTEIARDVIGMGARWDIGTGAYVDLAADLSRVGSTTSTDGAADLEYTGWDDYGLRARAFLAAGPDMALVPLVEHRRERGNWAFCGDEFETRHEHWRGGGAWTWLPDPDHLLVASLDYRHTREERGGDRAEENVLALRLALEGRVNAFLSFRGAAGWEQVRSALPGPFDRGSVHADHVPLDLGLALHLGPADLDLGWSNLPPASTTGARESWESEDDSTWMSASLGVVF